MPGVDELVLRGRIDTGQPPEAEVLGAYSSDPGLALGSLPSALVRMRGDLHRRSGQLVAALGEVGALGRTGARGFGSQMAEHQAGQPDAGLEPRLGPHGRDGGDHLIVDRRGRLDVPGVSEQVDRGGAGEEGDQTVTLPPRPKGREQVDGRPLSAAGGDGQPGRDQRSLGHAGRRLPRDVDRALDERPVARDVGDDRGHQPGVDAVGRPRPGGLLGAGGGGVEASSASSRWPWS